MGTFSFSGGVEVTGFISPTDPLDTYPVIDPLYGVDGLRNVNLLSDLNNIPELRRRAGMVVGVSGGTTYYKLNNSPWNYTISDWSIFSSGGGGLSGDYLPLSGGTVTGATVFNSGLTANTIFATTYLNLPIDLTITGISYSNNTLTISNNSGNTLSTQINSFTGLTINGILSATTISGGTLFGDGSNLTGIITSGEFLPLSGGTVTGDTTFTLGLSADTFSGTSIIVDSLNSTNNTLLNSSTNVTLDWENGLLTNSTGIDSLDWENLLLYDINSLVSIDWNSRILFDSNGNVILDWENHVLSGMTNIYGDTLSATTYLNLPLDVKITGFTYNNANTFTISDNSGSTYSATFNTVTGLTATTISATTYQNLPVTADTFTTGFSYSNNTFTINRNQSQPNLTATINTMTGLTVNGNFVVTGTSRVNSITGTSALFSGTAQNVLTVIGSGSTQPIVSVQGSFGELFTIYDTLTGSLFSVNDISGLPILEVFSDNTILMGSYVTPSLNTTTSVLATTGTTNVYSIPTSAYTGAFFDYTVSDGSNLRAGNIISTWSGSSVNYAETSTTDFGNTSGLTFNMVVSGGNAILRTSGVTGNWTVKTIVRSI
jgi:hypothetical protein